MMKNRRYTTFTLATSLLTVAIFIVVAACTDQQAKAKINFVYKASPKDGVVAKIGSEEISEDTLVGEAKLDFLEVRKNEYDLKMERLNQLMVEKLIGEEAKKANTPIEEYIEKKVIGASAVPDAEYNKFVEKLVKDGRLKDKNVDEKIKEQIMAFLGANKKKEKVQAYLAKLSKSHPVEVYFKAPRLKDVQVGEAPIAGGQNAKVTIIEFSDFQCPFCKIAAETVGELKTKYGNKVKLAFRHFPLNIHPQARPTSEASMCVNEQSVAKFWKFHDLAFQNQKALDAASLEKYAKEVGANVEKFKECMSSKKFAKAVQDDMAYGEKLGLKSTPTFFINGRLVSGALPLDKFSEIVDEELSSSN
jgi:protein-disulfide isomerase